MKIYTSPLCETVTVSSEQSLLTISGGTPEGLNIVSSADLYDDNDFNY